MARRALRTANHRVASVLRALRAIEVVAQSAQGIGLTDLAAKLGCRVSSLSKILTTVEGAGFVTRDAGTDRFHLSWRLLALAFGHANNVGLWALTAPILQALADETDELVHLVVVDGGEMRIVAKAEGPGAHIRIFPLVGASVPVHASVSGKLWLASLPEEEAARVLATRGMPRLTPHTIVSKERLLAELRTIRRRGYSTSDQELIEGGRAVAAAITRNGKVVGAVAVSGPTFRMPMSVLHRLAPRVKEAAAQLEAIWPPHVTSSDFGLVTRPALEGGPVRRDGSPARPAPVAGRRSGVRRPSARRRR